MSLLSGMLPVVAVAAFVAGALGYGAARLYGFGALKPEYLDVRKSAQSRAVSLGRIFVAGGVAGFGYLLLTGLLPEMLKPIAAVTLGLGATVWVGTEWYGRTRDTALTPVGRRIGVVAASAGLYLAGAGVFSLAPVVGLAAYTGYAAYKSE